MSVDLNYNSLHIRNYGTTCEVPNHDLAKLMYYLDCVDSLIPNIIDSEKYLDYRNYRNADSSADREKIISYALLLNPVLLIGEWIIIKDERLIPSGSNNTFYSITDDRINVHVNQEMMIRGRSVRIVNIMACQDCWIYRNYEKPMENFEKIRIRKNKICCICCSACFCCCLIIIAIIIIIVKAV